MDEIAIKFEDVKKEYRLGMIGGGTLRGDLQSWFARIRGKEDPNLKIGQTGVKNERFLALDGVSFKVKRGERLGIIGHNGAGKSTLLKLLSRVTAPTSGKISYNGRVASMLEVGTGFHPELTGRENVYLNGAILGMTKSEIDKKFDRIVEFSEIGQFIETPVKRYSSGMYVKLAFSVAAHLDSEIMIMDEVLAVGDMTFQMKCLDKMSQLAEEENRTVLYVSHNMNTIRQLCDRCIVLDGGKVVFDGDVEEAISIYLGTDMKETSNLISVSSGMRDVNYYNPDIRIEQIVIHNSNNSFTVGNKLSFSIFLKNMVSKNRKFFIRVMVKTINGISVTMSSLETEALISSNGILEKNLILDISNLVPGKYTLSFVLYEVGKLGTDLNIDVLRDIYNFSIKGKIGFNHDVPWNPQWWGYVNNGYLEEI